ncbi:LysR substrate-binding domain-containing protein [Sphingobium yanoikuyae]|uniref:LysR family transcriptional regulator n=1 Tax=Sphingobium yanoikuyae TaxID=13690 RepID=UPI00084693DB|nr:LysR substrate-binding domain-containing protein [Sphingobium yanoikuyae]MDG2514323.1 LysR substrate-binding domain-containing protein [Sphingobium yanoikuyae]
MIDIRQLRYFVAVAETLHFGRAAERLHVTQPPLSRQVAALEQELGVRLIERHSRRAVLTPAGARFLEDARQIIAALDRACRDARAWQSGDLGELTIGFMMHAAYSSVPLLTRRFATAHPDVTLHLRETLPMMLADGVMEGRFDAAIGFDPGARRGLATSPLYREPLAAVVPSDHHLASASALTPDQLAGERFILSPADVTPTLRRAILGWLAAPPAILLETQLQQTIVSLVGEGLGVAIVPESLRRLAMTSVRFVPLVDAPMVEQLLMVRPDARNPALTHLRAIADSLQPA